MPDRGRGRAGLPPTSSTLPSHAVGALRLLVEGVTAAAARAGVPARHVSSAASEPALRLALLQCVVLLMARARGLLGGGASRTADLWGIEELHGRLDRAWRSPTEPLARPMAAWPLLCAALDELSARAGAGLPLARATTTLAELPPIDDRVVYQALSELLAPGGQRLDYGALEVEQAGAIFEAMQAVALQQDQRTGDVTFAASSARRATGTHYTPRALTEPIVATALAPVLRQLGDDPPPHRLLAIRVCDPAMGAGAFLLAACRYLGDRLVECWDRRGELAAVRRRHGGARRWARRLVAERCLYGVDRDATAVELCKCSLWLCVADGGLHLDRLGRNLRRGDSVVGLRADQVASFRLDPGRSGDLLLPELPAALCEAAQQRCAAAHRATEVGDGPSRRGAADSEELLEQARWAGDLLVGAFFDGTGVQDREGHRRERARAVRSWLVSGGEPGSELVELRQRIRGRTPVLHWQLEFPELFGGEPHEGAAPGIDAFVGNPPFLGGKRISTEHGAAYAAWLQALHGSSKNTDLAAHFFLRASLLAAADGTIGLIATNSIAQGATRRDGLGRMVRDQGWRIYQATRSRPWPGAAAVSVAVVHLARGRCRAAAGAAARLDDRPVPFINSSLRAMPERERPARLPESTGLCFIGCFLRGAGFILSGEERRRLLAADACNATCVRPYLGGDEVNRSPRHGHHRYVIDFADRSLDEAAAWPELLDVVRDRVKPGRDRLSDRDVDRGHKRRWWQFANVRPELRRAIRPLGRCLVAPRVSKHLCFVFQPTNRIFSDQLCVFAIDDYRRFAVLQSRIHEGWARLYSSTFGIGLRYTPSVSVETFPFPAERAPSHDGRLSTIGRALYLTRAHFLRETGLGLTVTYNLLADRSCRARALEELRRLHEQLDRTVLEAYGWQDLGMVPFAVADGEQSTDRERWQARLIERLHDLNERRRGDSD